MEELLLNQIKTPDGTILRSHSRHDYVTHVDANGHEYMVDGGLSYLRRSFFNNAPFKEMSQYYKPNDHAHNREYASWGTYGKNGDMPLHYKLVKDMETSHLWAVLAMQAPVARILKLIMEKELEQRND